MDGVTVKPGASGVTIDGSVVSLEAGGSTLDIGTGRFVLTPTTGLGNASSGLVAFEGGQGRRVEVSLLLLLLLLLSGIVGILMTLIV